MFEDEKTPDLAITSRQDHWKDKTNDLVCRSVATSNDYLCGPLKTRTWQRWLPDSKTTMPTNLRRFPRPCVPGDSGGPVKYRRQARGLIWGQSNGDCVYSHIQHDLDAVGLVLVTS